ncbi:MAG TPA: hypothetical protein V6D08_12830 [Candidatus Obscuribacterales bacterium]
MRAVSLSQEPAFSALQSDFVCGVKDISRERYAGVSRKHDKDGQAIKTTNGAGPHNLQLFMLAPDGTVLHCLPGYWHPADLVREMELAYQLYDVWTDPSLSRPQKDELFRQMHTAHVRQHPRDMVFRSRMQGFDQQFEAKHRLYTSDTIRDPEYVQVVLQSTGKVPPQGFKTTDEIVHQRMALRPFLPYQDFDVARYTDYGRPFYDKHEDQRDLSGQRVAFERDRDKLIGKTDNLPGKRRPTRNSFQRYLMQRGMQYFLRYGVAAATR